MSVGKRKTCWQRASGRLTLIDMRRVFSILFAVVVALAMGAPVARADQKDPRLDGLFADLQKVTGTLQAKTIIEQIGRAHV